MNSKVKTKKGTVKNISVDDEKFKRMTLLKIEPREVNEDQLKMRLYKRAYMREYYRKRMEKEGKPVVRKYSSYANEEERQKGYKARFKNRKKVGNESKEEILYVGCQP